eukprot:CAMPEP_0168730942 /NCGR_PEP_ID=MMETSP0724-20121128/6994_1 /TAXON_ID=265536 /ORGANISM="Amphiprora sp., Strain CCMP467" /LENGTH=442 /DNA_ID=CAMNT_0008777903 /DNA_START=2293 /DNA_END=3621 /DNA_ORIENTATION=+
MDLQSQVEMLNDAAGRGDVVLVGEILDEHPDWIHPLHNELNAKPLHCACRHGQFATVQFLLEKGAGINDEDCEGDIPLDHAFGQGARMVQFLLDNGADVNIRNVLGETPLCRAVSHPVDVIQCLLDRGAEINSQDEDGLTTLHIASEFGAVDVARYLLHRGANANIRSIDKGRTPLHCAVSLNAFRCVLQHGNADVRIEDNAGLTVLHQASGKGRLDLVQCLLEHNPSVVDISNARANTPLHYASRHGHLNIVQYLVDNGGNVNSLNDTGESPLHWACKQKLKVGNLDVIRFLVEQGSSVNTKNNDGWTPLHFSSFKEHGLFHSLWGYDSGFFQFDSNDEIEIGAKYHWEFADEISRATVDEIQYLLEEGGADRDIQDNDGETPLYKASGRGHLEITRYFVTQCGANLNLPNTEGTTPLVNACVQERFDVVRFLLEMVLVLV